MSSQSSAELPLSLSCLICFEKVQVKHEILSPIAAQILSDLFQLFCKSMKCSPNESTHYSSYDFAKEPFPFCNLCKRGLVKLYKLNDQLVGVQKEINSVISSFTAKLNESHDHNRERAGREFVDIVITDTDDKKSGPGPKSVKSFVNCIAETDKKTLDLRKSIHNPQTGSEVKVRAANSSVKLRESAKTETNANSASEIDDIQIQDDDLQTDDGEIISDAKAVPFTSIAISSASNNLTTTEEVSEQFEQHQDSQGPESDDDRASHCDDAGPSGDSDDDDDSYEMSGEEEEEEEEGEGKKEKRKPRIGNTTKAARPQRIVEESPGTFLYGEKFYFVQVNEDSFSCKTCDGSFGTRKKCIAHIRTNHLYRSRYVCETCGKTFPQKCNLTTHNRTYHSNTPGFSCSKCGKAFKNYSLLYYHKNYHDCGDDFQFECDVPSCKKRFRLAAFLEHHKQTHSKPFACPKCPSRFGYKKGLNEHLNSIHSRRKPFLCSECGRSFYHRNQMNAHIRLKHSEPTQGVSVSVDESPKSRSAKRRDRIQCQCDICGNTYHSIYQLKLHKEGHENPPTCTECNRTYSTIKTLRDHLRARHGLQRDRHPCDVCGRVFRKGSRLKEHMESHERKEGVEGEHPCEVCGQVFRFTYLLEKHVLKHTGIHKCHICELTLTSEKYLKTHLKFHEEQALKRFRCSSCNQEFISKGEWARHVRAGNCGVVENDT